MTKNKYLSLALFLLITFLASGIGGFTTATFKEPWYSQIILPSFNPPSWVFGPVWTTLYILMSVAIWRVWINHHDNKILKLYFDKSIDLELIRQNLLKKQSKIQQDLDVVNKKLNNSSFVKRAPKHIVEQEKNIYNDLKINIEKITFTINSLK